MYLKKWEPFKDLMSIQERMNQLFDDTLSTRKEGTEEFSKGNWSPPVDIYETATHVVLKAEIPGISQDNIDIKIEDNDLVLKGERKVRLKTHRSSEQNLRYLYRCLPILPARSRLSGLPYTA